MNEKEQHLENNLTMDADGWSIAYDFLSSMIADALVVFDFDRETVRYISNNGLILCGCTQENPIALGSDYFKKVIHPKDAPFL